MASLIALTEVQAGQILYKDQFAYAALSPLRLTDGRYVVSAAALAQPEHAVWRSVLAAGTIVDSASVTIDSANVPQFMVTISGILLGLYMGETRPAFMGYPAPRLFDTPNTDLYRFEARYDSDPASRDRARLRRRVELIQSSPAGFQSGDTVWAAWSTIITDARDGFDQDTQALIHQWHQHPSSIYGPPPLGVVLTGGMLSVNNRSADSATNDQVYLAAAPDSWEVTHFVIQGTIGQSGHLRVWINGEKVCDKDTHIGYWGESLPYLARVTTGIYMDNVRTVDALYHANVAFGANDLSARVDTPLAIPAQGSATWIDDTTGPIVHYPDGDMYPATNLYPS